MNNLRENSRCRPETLTRGFVLLVRRLVEAARNREMGFLLAGDASRRIVSDAIPFAPQQATMVSFHADAGAVRRAVVEARARRLDILGVGHLHPGTGSQAAFHSATDEEAIERRLLPLLAAACLKPVIVERKVATRQKSGRARVVLDNRGDLEIVTGASRPPPFVTLRQRELHSCVSSLVFSQDLHVYALRLNFRHVPLPSADDLVLAGIDREEPPVRVLSEAALGLAPSRVPALDEIKQKTEREIFAPADPEPAMEIGGSANDTDVPSLHLLSCAEGVLTSLANRHPEDGVVRTLVGEATAAVVAIRTRINARPAEGGPCA